MPEIAVDLLLLDLEIGDGRQQLRIPVHKALVLVDQPFLVKRDEHFEHGLGQALVHGEALSAPVGRGAEPLQLVEDCAAGFGLPLPDFLDELLARQVAAMDLLLHQLALDHHLRGDTGMVHARLPQHVLAAHALEAHQYVLQRIVERVAHMQRAGDIRRRDDDGEGLGTLLGTGAGTERVGLFPDFGDLWLDGFGVVGFFEHGKASELSGFVRFGVNRKAVGKSTARAARLFRRTGHIDLAIQREGRARFQHQGCTWRGKP